MANAVEKTITCPAEKCALIITLMNQLGITVKSSEASATAGAIDIKADLTDDQVKALQNVISKIERRETVANVLHKTGALATKTVDFAVNEIAKPAVGVGLQVGVGLVGSVVKFGTETGARIVNVIAETGAKTVNDVRVSEDAQKFKGSLKTIGSCFGLFSDSNDSKTIKIA